MPNRSSSDASKATLGGYTLRAYRNSDPDQSGMRGWYSEVYDPFGHIIRDGVQPWLSQTEAEEHAEQEARKHAEGAGDKIDKKLTADWEAE